LYRSWTKGTGDFRCSFLSRMLWLASNRQKRFIVQQIAEDAFNKTKVSVGQGINRVCTPERVWATVIDKKVIEKTHHYEPVRRSATLPTRAPMFDHDLFTPVFRPSLQDKATRDLTLTTVSSNKEPTWYTAGHLNKSRPHLDLILAESARASGDISLMRHCWLSRLVTTGMVVRRVGTETWHVGAGSIASVCAFGWPVRGVEGPIAGFLPSDEPNAHGDRNRDEPG
jgi:hypothetical protein